MEGVRMPTCAVISFAGEYNTSVPTNNKLDDTNSHRENQQFLRGNRCGHDKNNPRSFISPSHHKHRPYILEEAKKRCRESYLDHFKYDFGRSAYNPSNINQDGSYRKVRSESRELLMSLIPQAILHYVDLKTNKLGFTDSNTGEFRSFGIDFLYKSLGGRVSYERVRKTVAEMEKLGYLTVETRNIKLPDGRYRAIPAIIRITSLLLSDIGFTQQEIDKYAKKDQLIINREILQEKCQTYKRVDREKSKIAKKHIKGIRDILTRARNGVKLNDDEQKVLDAECPGFDRKREPTTQYRDYTGISQNREEVLTKNGHNGSPQANNYLKAILEKLKPPS
jgi:hypothetical protein